MTVKELIDELSACDQSVDVVFDDGEDDGCEITGIETADDTVYLLSEDEEAETEPIEDDAIDVPFKVVA